MNPEQTRIAKTSAIAALLGLLTTMPAAAALIVVPGSGTSDPNSILSVVNTFRADLGAPNNANNPGPLASGRREINWDGGGAANTFTTPPPLDAFLNIRGGRFTTNGTGLLQAPPSGTAPVGMNNFFNNATYGTIFSTFSSPRDFTPVGSNITQGLFFIPGTKGGTPATVSGFGAVFTNVEIPNTTKIDFFGPNGNLLTEQFVPTGTGAASLSFLGVFGNAGEQIASVTITSGTNPLASGTNDNPGGGVNLVVMDDFIYGEPQALAAAVPEPASLSLLGMALAGMGLLGWRRRHNQC